MDIFLGTHGRRRVKAVLCLYLFVVHAAADCMTPDNREDLVLTNEAVLLNEFPEGSDVTLECGNGHVTDSGSGVITCVDGKWTVPDLTCKKMDCGLPIAKPHMSFIVNEGTLFGAIVRVVCDEGYWLSGNSYKHCYASGWHGRAKCELHTCEKPGEVTNGRHSWDSQEDPIYGEMVQYVCNEGYSLIGKENITCSEGEYDSQPPTCEGVTLGGVTVTTEKPSPSTSEPGVTTEHRITTEMAPTAATQTPGGRMFLTTVFTAHSDKTVTSSETPTVPASIQGGRDILTAEDTSTTRATSATPFNDNRYVDATNSNKFNKLTAGIIATICVSAVILVGITLSKFHSRRKGSYDTREDLKPELLQFQNL